MSRESAGRGESTLHSTFSRPSLIVHLDLVVSLAKSSSWVTTTIAPG